VSNVIDFLQRLGQNADVRHAPRTELELALAEANIDPALRQALLGTDQRKLENLLGVDTDVCCVIAPGRKEEEDEDEDEDEDDFDEEEDEEEDDYEDDDEDADDEDYDDEDEDDEDEEENSLTPRRSTVRRVA
jgi:hypothetical protein